MKKASLQHSSYVVVPLADTVMTNAPVSVFDGAKDKQDKVLEDRLLNRFMKPTPGQTDNPVTAGLNVLSKEEAALFVTEHSKKVEHAMASHLANTNGYAPKNVGPQLENQQTMKARAKLLKKPTPIKK